MAYLLDTDVFIQAKNLHYGFDFCPAFWAWIDAAHADGTVFSIEKVGDELKAGGDDLATWATQRPALFLKPDSAIVPSLQAASLSRKRRGFLRRCGQYVLAGRGLLSDRSRSPAHSGHTRAGGT
jgi:hypothetical protein